MHLNRKQRRAIAAGDKQLQLQLRDAAIKFEEAKRKREENKRIAQSEAKTALHSMLSDLGIKASRNRWFKFSGEELHEVRSINFSSGSISANPFKRLRTTF